MIDLRRAGNRSATGRQACDKAEDDRHSGSLAATVARAGSWPDWEAPARRSRTNRAYNCLNLGELNVNRSTGPAEPAEDLERLNHYQALGLTEAASSRAVSRGLWVERWPWHLVTEEARREATRRRVLAYGVLNDPHSRKKYDRELGLTWRTLAARVGELEALWGQVWLISLVVLAVLMVMAGPDDLARVIGANLAPGFKEEFVYHAAPPECAGCAAYLTREFRSSSDTWASFLNGWGIWIAPPLAVVLVGLAGKPLVNRAAGWAVAYVRFLGYRDTLTRAVLVALVLAVVIVMVALPVLSAPSPPPTPPGAD